MIAVFIFGTAVQFVVASQHQHLIDANTRQMTYARQNDGKVLELVMSDEFEENSRRFEKGRDRFFEAINQHDFTNQAIQYCKTVLLDIVIIFLTLYMLKITHLSIMSPLKMESS